MCMTNLKCNEGGITLEQSRHFSTFVAGGTCATDGVDLVRGPGGRTTVGAGTGGGAALLLVLV